MYIIGFPRWGGGDNPLLLNNVSNSDLTNDGLTATKAVRYYYETYYNVNFPKSLDFIPKKVLLALDCYYEQTDAYSVETVSNNTGRYGIHSNAMYLKLNSFNRFITMGSANNSMYNYVDCSVSELTQEKLKIKIEYKYTERKWNYSVMQTNPAKHYLEVKGLIILGA